MGARGFTLVEMVIVIAITGILAAAVAAFIRRPVEAYVDAARRGELSDIADTALRRITRDLRSALPNSIRIRTDSPPVIYLEYLLTSGGGRYRADMKLDGTGDPLLFTTGDGTFDVLGSGITIPASSSNDGNQIVVYNLGIPGADAYEGNTLATHVRRAYAGATGSNVTNISITSGNPLPFASPGRRFHVVSTPVTYACDPVGGTLRRFADYTIQLVQPIDVAATAPSKALLATSITGCTFTYLTTNSATARTSILALTLLVSQSGETVRLSQQVQVSNVP